jgi:hypothetical protein
LNVPLVFAKKNMPLVGVIVFVVLSKRYSCAGPTMPCGDAEHVSPDGHELGFNVEHWRCEPPPFAVLQT